MARLRTGCRKGFVLLLLLALGLPLTGCEPHEKVLEKVIYVPILADAGWLLEDGYFLKGVELAVEELNAEYGERGFVIRTAVIDDQARYELGVAKAMELAADPSVTAVLNLQNFDVSKTAADILARSQRPILFPYGAYDSLFTKGNHYLFCGVPSFSDLGHAMAMYVKDHGFRRIAVYCNGVQSQNELVTAFELALMDSQAKIVDYVSSIVSSSQFDPIYNRWEALGVDAVVIAQYGLPEAFAVLAIIRERDQRLAIIGEPIFNRANVLAQHKEAAEGMVVPSTLVLEESSRLTDFHIRYSSKYGEEADTWAVQGYDMMRLVADNFVVLESPDPELLASVLHREEGYQGAGRRIRFAAGGALVVDIAKLPMLTSRNGRFE
ncbi:MAG: ABC transporter substrate-binding protein [Limnochordia bacterium]